MKVLTLVRNELLRLARFEDALAAAEAEAAPYWASCPDSVQTHRMAAVALRADAEAVVCSLGGNAARLRPSVPRRNADTLLEGVRR